MFAPQPAETESGSKNSSYPVGNRCSANIMLAAIILLILVVLFVVFLHVYANKWLLGYRVRTTFIAEADSTATTNANTTSRLTSSPAKKGLESWAVDSLPLFVYKANEQQSMECVICLSMFEDKEKGRRLPRCSHSFHVNCIDMWLNSHLTCPVCRGPVIVEVIAGDKTAPEVDNDSSSSTSTTPDEDTASEHEERAECLSNVLGRMNHQIILSSNGEPVLEVVIEVPNDSSSSENESVVLVKCDE